MTTAEMIGLLSGLVLIISTITGSIVAVLNTRINAVKIDESKRQIEKLTADLEYTRKAAQTQNEIARENIILLGESMSNVRSDNAKLALVFNQLYNDFERVTGSKPPIDLQLLRDMRTLEYITGPLPHIEVK